MSLKNRAAEVAQEQGRKERDEQQRRRADLIQKIEEKIKRITGLPGVFQGFVDVAKVVSKRQPWGPDAEVVEHKRMAHVRVDDVDLLVSIDDHRASSDGLNVTLGEKDPEHGWFQPHKYHSFYAPVRSDDMSDEERTEKFIRELGLTDRRDRVEHPVIQLQNKPCPTCGRNF